jgi:hypothetical protein
MKERDNYKTLGKAMRLYIKEIHNCLGLLIMSVHKHIVLSCYSTNLAGLSVAAVTQLCALMADPRARGPCQERVVETVELDHLDRD